MTVSPGASTNHLGTSIRMKDMAMGTFAGYDDVDVEMAGYACGVDYTWADVKARYGV